MKLKKSFLLLCILFFLGAVSLIHNNIFRSWSTFITSGPLTGQILKEGDTLIFGTHYSKLYFLNTADGTKVQTFDLNSGDVVPQVVLNDNLLVVSGDSLRSINIKNNIENWRVSTDTQQLFQRASIYKDKVLVSSLDGSLYAYRLVDGKRLWKLTPKPLVTLSSINFNGNLNYFGDFTVAGNMVYLESRDKFLYVADIKTGKLIWKTEIGDSTTSGIELFSKYLYLTTVSGDTISIDRFTGKILWRTHSDSPVLCSRIASSLGTSGNPLSRYISALNEYFRNWVSVGKLAYFELHQDGTFVRRNGKDGSVVWTEKLGPGLNCPLFWRNEAVFTGTEGNLIVVSLGNGRRLLEKSGLGMIMNPAIVEPKFGRLIPEWLNVFSPDYYVNNSDGDLWRINGRTGDTRWEFSSTAPAYFGMEPYLDFDNNKVYFPTSDGVIYKLDKNTGLPELSRKAQEFKVTQTSTKVADVTIYEINLTTDEKFTNPWREASLDAVFTHESGVTIEIPGFYYDQNIWKIRFNPPLKGEWSWKIKWSPHGRPLVKTGTLNSESDTSKFYLRTNTINSRRLTLDGKTIFNGLGIEESLNDSNINGSYLDDWAIGDASQPAATGSSGFTGEFKSDKVNNLEDFISAYGPEEAGFNLFRLNDSSSVLLKNSLVFPTEYSIHDGKLLDDFAENLRKNNIHLWLTLFGFDIPFKNSLGPNEKYLLSSYLRYVYARYGAYIDIWELGNELVVPDEFSKFLIDEIHALDYEKRPISISSELYNFDQADIIAPHWYETENIRVSDLKTAQHIQDYWNYGKPVVIAEQGNLVANYDDTSAIRMRIRAWTAFFDGGILIFWNQSDSKYYKSNIFPANIYLGEVEQSYTRVLQNFSRLFPLNSRKVKYSLDKSGIRGYGLNSDSVNAGYFYHFSNPFSPAFFHITLFTKNGGELQWINPATGAVIQKVVCPAFKCSVTSPSFNTDIFFYLK